MTRFSRALTAGLGLFLVFFSASSAVADGGFPGRPLFHDVPVIETKDLHQKRDGVVVVDVRSQFEYDTLRIKDAVHIPISDTKFGATVAELRKTTKNPIVFYCNGRSCLKSYEAVRKARLARVDDTYAFDAGIIEWAEAYPAQTTLLGNTPIKAGDLIDNRKFEARLLPASQFKSRMAPQTLVLDVRDRMQRSVVSVFPAQDHIALDESQKLERYLEKAKKSNSMLLIYDQVGHQVRWLQYYLERRGIKNYYFLKEGAEGYLKSLGR